MSDSEDEAAFASADEGEEVNKPTPKAAASAKKVKAATKGSTQPSGDDGAAAGKGDQTKKGKGKPQQQQKGKKKGKGKSQPSPSGDSTTEAEGKTASDVPQTLVKQGKSDDGNSKTKTSEKTQSDSTTSSQPSKVTREKDNVGDNKRPSSSNTGEQDGETKSPNEETSTEVPAVAAASTPSKNASADTEANVIEKTVEAGAVRKGLSSDITSPEGQAIPRDQAAKEGEVNSPEESTQKSSGGGWGWGNWGSSLISAASSSVQTFTTQVGDGFTTIMDTVESSLGVPEPDELAKVDGVKEPTTEATPQSADEEKKQTQVQDKDKIERKIEEEAPQTEQPQKTEEKIETKQEAPDSGSSGWFSSWGVADLAKKVQDTGKTLASKGQTLMSEGFDAVENLAAGGIDVLETIGKKTYSTLSEHDPALRKTREFLNPKANKPNLSSVLREAKDQAEVNAEQEKENEEARKAHFGTLFDDYQGIAHLEALEMLSNQSEKKVHSLLNSLASSDLATIKPVLIAIKEAFEVNDLEDEDSEVTPKDQDFSSLVSQHLSELELGTAPDKLNKVHEMVKQWIVDFDASESHDAESVKRVHQRSIQSLAELTSKGVEQFHKSGELVLMERDSDKDCTERAHSLARLTSVLCHEVGNLATKFAGCLNKVAEQEENADEITGLVTNIYLEASNSSTYLQDAFQLLLPVLQQAALEHAINSRHQS